MASAPIKPTHPLSCLVPVAIWKLGAFILNFKGQIIFTTWPDPVPI
jgi:hypothetical protein